MFVSIIIPLVRVNEYIRESAPHILRLAYPSFEVLILPNEVTEADRQEFSDPRIRLIPSARSSPAYKRNLGAEMAQGEILAFLDDDAYPKADWLSQAVKHFARFDVAGVGGPAVTPAHDSFGAKLSGAVYTSRLGSGQYVYRYWPMPGLREVDDLPSVNLFVRKSVFQDVGGFAVDFWPGEDTKLCLDIVQHGAKIIYDPAVFVWHHRRPSLAKHFSQVAGYGRHRGHFMVVYPETSRRLWYFFPTFFLLFFFGTPLLFFISPFFIFLYCGILLVYGACLLFAGMREGIRLKQWSIGLAVMPMIFVTHLVYGYWLIIGMCTRQFQSRFRT